MELIGWIGAMAFTFCAVPQAYKSIKDGHSNGLSIYYLLLWLTGEIFTIIYVIPQGKLPLTVNYIGNLIVLLVILKYKFYPREERPEIKSVYDENGSISAPDIMRQDFAQDGR